MLALVASHAVPSSAGPSGPNEDIPAIAQRIGELFESVTRKNPPVKRPVFGKAHGCVQARFDINPKLPDSLKVGAFARPSYPAWIRWSNDGAPRPDGNPTARGMAIKLVGVAGPKLLEGEEGASTQDFIMQNHPIFFVDTAKDFLDFTESGLSGDAELNRKFNEAHPETQRILAEMDKNVLADPLDGQYWTPTPYRLGAQAIKYMVKPCGKAAPATSKPMTDPNFLRKNLAAHLAQGDSCMGFWVQLQKDPVKMPIDRATVLWNEKESPFILAATITIPKGQDINAPARDALCENLSYTGWHSLPEHEPLGSLNQARKFVYKRLADYRRKKNGAAVAEPASIEAGQ
jgi:catalase